MIAMSLPQVLNHSIKPVLIWLRVRRLQRRRAAALRHMDVCQRIIDNELQVKARYQTEEMKCRNALTDMGVTDLPIINQGDSK